MAFQIKTVEFGASSGAKLSLLFKITSHCLPPARNNARLPFHGNTAKRYFHKPKQLNKSHATVYIGYLKKGIFGFFQKLLMEKGTLLVLG